MENKGVLTTWKEVIFADSERLEASSEQLEEMAANVTNVSLRLTVGVQFPVIKVKQDPNDEYSPRTLRRSTMDSSHLGIEEKHL